MTNITYKTLIHLSLKISELLSLYIEPNSTIGFPEVSIKPDLDGAQLLYVNVHSNNTELLGIVSCHDLFEDVRSLCRDWNNLVKTTVKGNKPIYGLRKLCQFNT